MGRTVVRFTVAVACALVAFAQPAVAASTPALAAPGPADAGATALLIGGDRIVINGRQCVIGFNAYSRSGRYIVTSSACAGSGNGAGAVPAPAGSTSTAFVGNGAGNPLYTVGGATPAPVGSTVCMSGPVGGVRCGTVVALNQTVNFGGQVIYGLTRTTVCAYPGETGAPFFTVVAGKAQAQGTLVGGTGVCGGGATSWFKPIGGVLTAYGLTLYTG
jgi:streptogrisin C